MAPLDPRLGHDRHPASRPQSSELRSDSIDQALSEKNRIGVVWVMQATNGAFGHGEAELIIRLRPSGYGGPLIRLRPRG